MMKKTFYNVVGMFVLSLMLCSVGFAVDIPDGVALNDTFSGPNGEALKLAKKQFTILKEQLTLMAKNSPPDQQAMIDGVLAKVEDKLERTERIDVYFAAEKTPGDAYGAIYDFYKGKLSEWQDVAPADIQYAVTQVPPEMIPDATMDSLMALLDESSGYDVKAAAGKSGKSRVSVLTVYLNPTTLELIKGTTIVVATDK